MTGRMPDFERSIDGLKHRIVAFEELVAPLSQGKVMLVVECLSFESCDKPELRAELSKLLNLESGTDYDEWEEFLDYGFVVVESELTAENRKAAILLLDYLKDEKFINGIQADLFVEGEFLDSSWNGKPEICKASEIKQKPLKSVVIRFPVEKTNRCKDNGIQK